ncbi:hypothetical protein H5410_027855 [Solanum commersonii]|uniref:Uncharacterized protein n=1 Tax=Solanum commersonii TaxID=4109 RepID=A0A9J5Z0B2_SOLCO|nr:hypothetical protein H5410_027855 [Solanum commersonii]
MKTGEGESICDFAGKNGDDSGDGFLRSILVVKHSSGDVVAFETLYTELGDKSADKKLYRLTKETLIKQRWQPYFHQLLKEVGDKDIVLGDLEHSKRHQRLQIPMEFWKSTNRTGLEWLTSLFNVIFKMAKMPKEWRWSTMVPLYKNKVIYKIPTTREAEEVLGRADKTGYDTTSGYQGYDPR